MAMKPGDHPGAPAFDAGVLVAGVDELLAADAEGVEEAAMLEEAHRLITDAMEGR